MRSISPRHGAAAVFAAVLAFLLAACGTSGSGDTGTQTGATRADAPGGPCATLAPSAAKAVPDLPAGLPCPGRGKNWKIGILHVGDCPYCSQLYSTYQEQAQILGVSTTILNAQLKPDLQSQQMDQLIAQRPDIIIAIPVDTKALIPGMARAKAAGIPVLDATIKVDDQGDQYVIGYTGIDDVLAGKLSAQVMLDGLKAKNITSGTVAIVAGGAGGSEVLRTQGFKDEMAASGPGFTVSGPEYTDFTKEQALSKANSIITRTGSGLAGIWAEDDTLVSGVAQAVSDAGKTNDLVVVGMNGNKSGISLIESGHIYGTVLQQPNVDAAWSIIYAIDYLDGQIPARNLALVQPKITKDNVAQFSPGW
jgi:ribose transport system substrate-binding protein